MSSPVHVTMVAGMDGPWRIDRISPVSGAGLPAAARLEIREGVLDQAAGAAWSLRSFTSNARYVTADEQSRLNAIRTGLGRPEATRAALIPIRKTQAWWDLAQDRRRWIMEESSRHISIGMEYLDGIARRLLHARDLGEPFDFLTWFEFAPSQADAFEELVVRLRRTEEWEYVEREVDVRLSREDG